MQKAMINLGLELRKKYCSFFLVSMYNDKVQNKPDYSMVFSSFLIQPHSINSRQTQADVLCDDYFKVIFWKNNSWKMEILQIFVLWNQ